MNTETATAKNSTSYSPEEEKILLTSYNPDEPNREQVAEIAAKVGRSVHSVRSKLSNLGVYVKDETTKGKKGGVTKIDIASRIGESIGLSETETEALAKTTFAVLNKLADKIAPTNDSK